LRAARVFLFFCRILFANVPLLAGRRSGKHPEKKWRAAVVAFPGRGGAQFASHN
jgi:hypothetical protein